MPNATIIPHIRAKNKWEIFQKEHIKHTIKKKPNTRIIVFENVSFVIIAK